jgi:hypothetical protein
MARVSVAAMVLPSRIVVVTGYADLPRGRWYAREGPRWHPGRLGRQRGPAVADVAMTRGKRALWIALIAAQVLIALADGAVPDSCSGQIRAESQSGMGDMSGDRNRTPIAVLGPQVQDP